MTNSEVIEMLKEMQEKTANTMGFFVGHVTQLWVIRELLGSKIAELEKKETLMESNKCVCNQCGNEIMIHLNEEAIDQDNNGKDVTEQFFVCPGCGRRYTVMILDEYMRTLIRMRKRPPFNRKNNDRVKKDMMQHFKRLKKKYGRE